MMMRTKHKQGVRMASERIAVAESAISGLLSGAASRGPCGGSTSPATISFTKQYSTMSSVLQATTVFGVKL